jgi:hypothetical protein
MPARKLTPEEIAKQLGLGVRCTVVNFEDMCFLHDIGSLDWHFAGTLCFQRLIRERGTPEEKRRLREMNVGFRCDTDGST